MPPDDRHCIVVQRSVIREWIAERSGFLHRDVGEVGSRRVEGCKPLGPHGTRYTALPRNELDRQRAFIARQWRTGNSGHRPSVARQHRNWRLLATSRLLLTT